MIGPLIVDAPGALSFLQKWSVYFCFLYFALYVGKTSQNSRDFHAFFALFEAHE
jgi:hypothetical protein